MLLKKYLGPIYGRPRNRTTPKLIDTAGW